jgi:hypothetical protein
MSEDFFGIGQLCLISSYTYSHGLLEANHLECADLVAI